MWFPAPRAVELHREHVGEPREGEVQVTAVASGISQGTERLVFRGEVPPGLALDLPTLAGSFDFPIKYGYAVAGQVTQVGPRVERLAPGQLVFVHHPHQSLFNVEASLPVPLPQELDAEAGVFFANLETAVNICLDATPRIGERVAVFGQGVVGLLVTALLARGQNKVVAVDPIPRRRKLALELGAMAAVAPDEARERVEDVTGGLGADIVIEASGSPAALAAALDCAAFQGTILVASWYGTKPVELALGGPFHRRRLRLVSSQVGSVDPALQPRWTVERRREVAAALLVELAPLAQRLVTHRFPLDCAADAYRLIDERPDEAIQVLFTYADV